MRPRPTPFPFRRRRSGRFAGPVLLALLLALLLSVAGCSGLPEELQRAASLTGQRVDAGEEAITKKRQQLEARLASESLAYLRPYAEQERWSEGYGEAARELGRARELFAGEVAPLLDENRPEGAELLATALARIDKTLDRFSELLAVPATRADQLVDAHDNAPARVAEIEQRLAALRSARREVEAGARQASQDYPDKRDDLTGRIAAIGQRSETAEQSAGDAAARLSAHQAGQADLAQLADSLLGADSALDKGRLSRSGWARARFARPG